MASQRRPANLEVIAKIEDIFEDITDSLLCEIEMSIPLRNKRTKSPMTVEPEAELSSELMIVSFPAKTSQDARRFSTYASNSRSLAIVNSIFSCIASYPRTYT